MTLSKRDIENRADLERLLEIFYKKVFNDDLISHFFIEVVPLNLETHIPVIADFWESVLLDGRGYRKNVMEVHLNISEKSKINKEHLDRWVKIFSETVDELFEGAKASLAKQRAASIATMMNIKIDYPNPLKR
jgi:hemoglobin